MVGGSKGTIYSNFGSKERLFEAVVEQMCADVCVVGGNAIDASAIGIAQRSLGDQDVAVGIGCDFQNSIEARRDLHDFPGIDIDRHEVVE